MTEGKIPEELRYTDQHEWIREDGGELVVGITDHAQSELTDIVFVDLPAAGKEATAGQSVLVLESVKTVADVYAPAPGTITKVNEELKKHPELINKDPYGGGWIFRLRPTAPAGGLLSPAEYRAFLAKT
ncbi:MAG TPA: glycine cleavage system protein GcvH [Thermoplasmata archaeon]|nr:glycine cleavage system protein GcvH [Thermoplasmata archaeon]